MPRNAARRARLPRSLAVFLALAYGCDAGDPGDAQRTVDVDLSAYGVDRVLHDDGRWRLLDAQGVELGRIEGTVDAGSVDVHVVLADQAGAFAWSADGAQASCDETSAPDPAAPLAACVDALAVGARVAAAEGSPAPWARDDEDMLQYRATCQSVSSWVWGSSCNDCMWATSDQFRENQSVPDEVAIFSQPNTWQCSSGYVYTSCSRTLCWNPPLLD